MGQIILDPDNYPSVEAEPLTLFELGAKAHWERFCPGLVASLRRQGEQALDTAIRAVAWRLEYQRTPAGAQPDAAPSPNGGSESGRALAPTGTEAVPCSAPAIRTIKARLELES